MTELLIRMFVKNSNKTDDPAVRFSYGRLASFTGIVCNLIVSIGKILLGILIGSVAILADGINNMADASSSVISLIGFKLADRPADEEHPYGHGRYEYISALIVAMLVAVIGVELMKSSFDKILHPSSVKFNVISVIILSVSILVKFWMMCFYRKIGQKIDSGTLIAASVDSRNDVIATVAVLASLLISRFTSLEIDGYVGMAVALFILYSSYGLIRDTLNPMLGSAPNPEFVLKIRNKVMSYPEVLGIHDLLIHDYGPGRLFGSVHVEMAAEGDVMLHHDIIDNIERDCLSELGVHLIIHYDPIMTSDSQTNALRDWLSQKVKEELDPLISVHDLRTVPGASHTNVIFDVAVPYSFAMSDIEIKKRLREILECEYADHYAVITVDRMHAYMPH